MLPILISPKGKDGQDYQMEHLFIRHALELVEQTNLGDIDIHLVGQYAMESDSFNPSDTALCERFLKNHRRVIQQYVLFKYGELLRTITEYMRLYLQEQDPVVLTPELLNMVVTTFDRIFPELSQHWISGISYQYNDYYVEVEMLYNLMLQYYLETGCLPQRWNQDFPMRKAANTGPVLERGKLQSYIEKMPESYFHAIQVMPFQVPFNDPTNDIQQSADVLNWNARMKFFGRILTVLNLMVHPYYVRPQSTINEFERMVTEGERVPGMLKYRHLAGLPLPNAVCTGEGIIFDDAVKSKYALNGSAFSLVERYLYLAERVHKGL